MWGWDSIMGVCKTVRENAPDQRIFWPTFVEEIIKDSGLPGVRPLCRAWKESRRNISGVASQMHSQGKVNGERISTDERGKNIDGEKCMMLIPTAPPKSTARKICSAARKICSAARKIDRTVREDVPAMLKQYTPDPKQLQHVVRENAPDVPNYFNDQTSVDQ